MNPHENPPEPYVLWTGNTLDARTLKAGYGLRDWRPESVVAQTGTVGVSRGGVPSIRFIEPTVDAIRATGAKTLMNVCNDGKPLPDDLLRLAESCLCRSVHVASGLHRRIGDVLPAYIPRTMVHDFRHTQRSYPLGTGLPRSGLRLLTVGPDGVVGKKYAALAIRRELEKLTPCTYCASGQGGRLLCRPDDRWIVMDTTPVDFASGAAEWLSPANDDPGHWYVVEGQASAFHPAWGAPSFALLTGTRPDALVYCAIPGREKLLFSGGQDVPFLHDDISDIDSLMGLLGMSSPLFLGIAVNWSEFEGDRDEWVCRTVESVRDLYGITSTVFDPTASAGRELKSICYEMAKMSFEARS